MAKLTRAQKDVLEWLLAYPDIEISCEPPDKPVWTAAWMNETARLHMLSVLPLLGFPDEEVTKAQPRWKPQREGTPRITKQTFDSLHMRGLIRAVKMRPAGKGWSQLHYYQITDAGEMAVLEAVAL